MSDRQHHPTGTDLLDELRVAAEAPVAHGCNSMRLAMLLEAAADEIEFFLDRGDVTRFARLMIAKLARKAREGRQGWRNCSPVDLMMMLREHVNKGDMIDVANFAMMIHYLTETDEERPE